MLQSGVNQDLGDLILSSWSCTIYLLLYRALHPLPTLCRGKIKMAKTWNLDLHHLGPLGIDKKFFLWLECIRTKHDENVIMTRKPESWMGWGGGYHIFLGRAKILALSVQILWPMSVTLTFCCKGRRCRPSNARFWQNVLGNLHKQRYCRHCGGLLLLRSIEW